ncbi:hypothetical protein O9992_00220 [Vibrio lentus]|nr:hypothetical protein [Vibrio lentus]
MNWIWFLKSRWNDKLQGAVINLPANHYFDSHLHKNPLTDISLFGQLSNFYAQSGFIGQQRSLRGSKFYFNGNNSIWQCGQ